MTTSPISPSIGRVVLVVRHGETTCGLVTRVHSNDVINVTVMADGGMPYPATSLPYSEDGDGWHWMDYQKKVAAEQATV